MGNQFQAQAETELKIVSGGTLFLVSLDYSSTVENLNGKLQFINRDLFNLPVAGEPLTTYMFQIFHKDTKDGDVIAPLYNNNIGQVSNLAFRSLLTGKFLGKELQFNEDDKQFIFSTRVGDKTTIQFGPNNFCKYFNIGTPGKGKYQKIQPSLSFFYNYLRKTEFMLKSQDGRYIEPIGCGGRNWCLKLGSQSNTNAIKFLLNNNFEIIILSQTNIEQDSKIDFYTWGLFNQATVICTYDINSTEASCKLIQKDKKNFQIISRKQQPDKVASSWSTNSVCLAQNDYLGLPGTGTTELLLQIELVNPKPEWLFLFKDYVINDSSSVKATCASNFNLYNPNCASCFNSTNPNSCNKYFDNTCRVNEDFPEAAMLNPACVEFCSQENLTGDALLQCQNAFMGACTKKNLSFINCTEKEIVPTDPTDIVCKNVFKPTNTNKDKTESENLANKFWNQNCKNNQINACCKCINENLVNEAFTTDIKNYFENRRDEFTKKVQPLIDSAADEKEKEYYTRGLNQGLTNIDEQENAILSQKLVAAPVCMVQDCFNTQKSYIPRTNKSKCNVDKIDIKICENSLNIISKDSDIDAKIFQSCFDGQKAKVNWVLIIGIILVIAAMISLGIIIFT